MTSDDYIMFTLKRSVVSDAGTYCILAKNIYGCDRAFVTVVVRQRASSENLISDWTYPDDNTYSYSESYSKNKPARMSGEPTVTDGGNNWVSLTWDKPDPRAGMPILAYKVDSWLVGKEGGARWTELGITPINSFDAFNLKQGEEYHFRVTPKNRNGWGESIQTSNPIGVGMDGNLPEFIEILPGQLKALYGDRATLRCCVRGKPAPRVVWFKNGQELEEEGNRVLTTFNGYECCLVFNEVRMEDDARYSCEATNSMGRVSTYARLSVVTDRKIWEADIKLNREMSEESTDSTYPPQFTMRLRDRRVQMTYPVRLTCQVTGNPAPSVTWYKDEERVQADYRHSFCQDEHFHTLEISQTTLSDGGTYEAEAHNLHGTVSCKCNLVVDKGIRAYISPEFCCGLEPLYTIAEGGELRISAVVEAYPSVGVAWHRDGIILRPSRRAVMTLDRDGSVELALANITPRDAGVYTCTATNEVGRSTTSCRVEVVEEGGSRASAHIPTLISPDTPYSKEPMFVKKPRSSEAYEGDTVIIYCEVVGDPKPDVVWLRDFLKPDYYRDATHFRRVGDGPEYRLEIPHAKLDYTGAYSVIAKNCHGEAKAIISLQIYAKGLDQTAESRDITHGKVDVLPRVTRPLNDLRCCDGDSVTFTCVVTGTPSPSIRWDKDGKRLITEGDFVAKYENEEASLTLKTAFPEDQGQYTCVAYNDLGHVSTTACLIVDVPEERSNLLSRQLSRPPDLLLSAGSTPRSTPRGTPRATPSTSRGTTPIMAECLPDPRRQFTLSSCLKKVTPKFYAYPHNRVVEEGGLARFQCAVAGHPSPWASWDKDGTPLSPSSRITITERDDLRIVEIEPVKLEDAGLYRIVLENDVGHAEATARLDVISLKARARGGVRSYSSPRRSPIVRSHMTPSTLRAGDKLRLQAEFDSASALTYKWFRNGLDIDHDKNVKLKTDGNVASLEIHCTKANESGEYLVIAQNEYGIVSSFTDVRILETNRYDGWKPLFRVGLSAKVFVHEGNKLEMLCQVDSPFDYSVHWYFKNMKLCPKGFFSQVKKGDNWYALIIDDIYIEDSGAYWCVAENTNGTSITKCNVIVQEEHARAITWSTNEAICQFVRIPAPLCTYPGSTAMFSAQISSSCPEVQILWYVNGEEISDDDPRFHIENDNIFYNLYIVRVDRSMAGEIKCIICRKDGQKTPLQTCTTTLNLIPNTFIYHELCVNETVTPKLVAVNSDITVLRGQTFKMRVIAYGIRTTNLFWSKGGKIIHPDFNKFPKYSEVLLQDGIQLLVIKATDEDAGTYNIDVAGKGTDPNVVISVRVVGTPDAPKGKPTTNLKDKVVQVTWSQPSYDGSLKVIKYSVEMATQSMVAENDNFQLMKWKQVACVEALRVTIHDLQYDNIYYFRVKAINSQGASPPSEISDPVYLEDDDSREEEVPVGAKDVEIDYVPNFYKHYELMKSVGKGNFGVVKLIRDRITGKKFAAKIMEAYKENDRKNAFKEIQVLNMLKHEKILLLIAAYQDSTKLVMVTEYLSGGELFERASSDDFNLTEDECITFIKQICEGVAFMHSHSVVHLDLKPENVVCRSRSSNLIKIVDFGLAQIMTPGNSITISHGTRDFISPEVVNYEAITYETDMWSVGVISYVLLSGLVPFKGDNWCQVLVSISNVEYDFDDECFDLVSDEAKDFISKLLIREPKKRMSGNQSLKHPWLTQQGEVQRIAKLDKDNLRKFTIKRKWQILSLRETG